MAIEKPPFIDEFSTIYSNLNFQGISIATFDWLTHVDGVPAIVLFLLAIVGDTLKGS